MSSVIKCNSYEKNERSENNYYILLHEGHNEQLSCHLSPVSSTLFKRNRILSKSAEICFSLRSIKTPPPYEAKGWTKEIPMSRSCRSNSFFILILFILIFILIPLLLTISRRHRFLLHAIITVFPACFLSLEEDSRLRLCYNKGHRRVRQRSIHVHSSLPPP